MTTPIEVGVVDVLVFRGPPARGEVLVLRRGQGTRCTGAWEIVHGRIEPGERPEEAAVREVYEETGLAIDRLYSLACQPFYLHRQGVVQLAVIFVAFAADGTVSMPRAEHDRAEWLSAADATARLTWPRSVAALRDAVALLRDGHAGPAEDVLRVR